MGVRGRTSTAALTVVGPSGIETIRRPDPPKELNTAAAEEWRAIVNRMPADWFPRETHPMLVQLCRHTVRCHSLAKVIEQVESTIDDGDGFNSRAYRALLRSEEQLSETIAKLCTKMRISQQASYDKRRKKTVKPKGPWEEDD